jgi:hypothetical protein
VLGEWPLYANVLVGDLDRPRRFYEQIALPGRVAWFRDPDGHLLSIVEEGA